MTPYTIWNRLFPRSGWDAYLPEGMNLQPGYGCTVVKRWRWWVFSPLGAMAAHLYQCGGALWLNPHIPDRLALAWLDGWDALSDWCATHIEVGSVPMQWNEPLSENDGEVGFHSASDGSHVRSSMRIFVHQWPA